MTTPSKLSERMPHSPRCNLMQPAKFAAKAHAEQQARGCTCHVAEVRALEDKVPVWIPVEERLPRAGDTVLTFCKDKYEFKVEQFWGAEDGDPDALFVESEWCCVAENKYERIKRVTHWMPLPSPPEDKP